MMKNNSVSAATQEQKIAALKQAIANYQPGDGGLLDPVEEEKLAPAKAKAVRLINHRARSAYELSTRLLAAEFAPEIVERVVQRCKENGMINDEAFAYEWVRQRQANQKKSRAVLRRELQDKGIALALIEATLENIDDEEQEEILWSVVWKKALSIKQVPADKTEYDKALRRIVGVAARRGFPQGQSLRIAKQALNQRCEELE